MNKIQEKLYKLIQTEDITKLSLREIGEKVGVHHPQSVKHHLSRLIGAGYVSHKPGSKNFKIARRVEKNGIITIPVLNEFAVADSDLFSIQNTNGNLCLASSILTKQALKKIKTVYAVKVFGNLMNRTNLLGKTIDEGDYVLIDFSDKNPKNGEIVLSTTQGFGAVRKYLKDDLGQILLLAESSQDYPPIYLDERIEHYVLGKVLQVIKQPKVAKKIVYDN